MQAEESYGQCIAIKENRPGKDAPALAVTLSQALVIAERCEGATTDEAVPILHYLALAHTRLDHPERARTFNERTLTIQERKNGKGHHDNVVHQLNIARNADAMRRAQEAEGLYRKLAAAALPAYQLTDPQKRKLYELPVLRGPARLLEAHGGEQGYGRALSPRAPVHTGSPIAVQVTGMRLSPG